MEYEVFGYETRLVYPTRTNTALYYFRDESPAINSFYNRSFTYFPIFTVIDGPEFLLVFVFRFYDGHDERSNIFK